MCVSASPFSTLCPISAQVLAGISNHTDPIFQELLDELRKICGLREVLPESFKLSESLLGCVYEGTFKGSKVRIRRVKTYPGGDPRKVKEVRNERCISLPLETHRLYRFSIE
jgi:hypothetical protein